MELSIDISEIEKEIKQLGKVSEQKWPKYSKRAMGALAQAMVKEAKPLCPISPKKSQYEATLQDGVTLRDASSFQPGTLTKSIMSKSVDADTSLFFIASNKGAGAYADKMENEQGKSWYNVGIGSRAKGSDVKGKFMARAIDIVNRKRAYVVLFDKAFKDLKRDLERKT